MRELTEVLGSWRVGAPPVLDEWLPMLADALGTERIGAYTLRVDQSLSLEHGVVLGAACGRAEALRRLADFVFRRRRAPGAFDIGCPEPEQRDRVIRVPPPPELLADLRRQPNLWQRVFGIPAEHLAAHLEDLGEPVLRPLGFDRHHQMRVLVCDGATLLAHIGAAQEQPFTERQRLILCRVLPALRERLRLEQRLRDAPLTAALLEASLEAIAVPAFLLDPQGHVRQLNGSGAHLREELGDRLRDALAAAVAGARVEPEFELTRVDVPGLPRHYLAVRRTQPVADEARIASARARWKLTPRQAEVLARVVRGDSNKAIALELRLGQSTVELHVSKLLEKAGVASRSELLAAFWTS